MKETVKGPSARFKKKVLARWRWLAARGVDVEQAAEEIGVGSTELRAWAQEIDPMMPLLVPVHVEGETMDAGSGGLVAVLAGGVRIEGRRGRAGAEAVVIGGGTSRGTMRTHFVRRAQ